MQGNSKTEINSSEVHSLAELRDISESYPDIEVPPTSPLSTHEPSVPDTRGYSLLEAVRARGASLVERIRTGSNDSTGSLSDVRPRALTFSPHAPDHAPAVLTFKDIMVTTGGGDKNAKILLNNISGTITGGFWAIMGSSGGGKTTLLSTLSLRLDTNKMNITGEFRLNGREYSKAVLKAMSAYVMQDDLLHPELTVKETISYAAQLRYVGNGDETITAEERVSRENEVIELMGIGHIRDVIIGDTRRKGISGGERKRVCVAIELLNRPKLLFLDEPTSGLDSSTAFSLCAALKNLADLGVCTVVCTIHQPQVKIFDLFDNLILMKKGQIVYQGSCKKSLLFLEVAGTPCPPGVNPADHLLDVLSKQPTSATDASSSSNDVNAFDANSKKEVPVNLSLGHEKSFYQINRVDADAWCRQFAILFKRSWLQYFRRKDIIFMNFIGTLIMAFFVGSGIWFQIGNNQASIATRVPSLFFACVTQGIVASLQCISSFPLERAIVLRERAAGAYFVSSYFLAKTCSDILAQTWGPTLFCIIVYYMVGYQGSSSKFCVYWGFMLLDSVAALSLATMVACVCVSLEMSTVVLSVLLELSRLYGGFFTSPEQLNLYANWRFADALSYLKYTFVGVALNELTGLELTCTAQDVAKNSCITKGEVISAQRGYDQYTMGFCAGILVVYIVGCRIVAYIALRVLKA